MSGTLTSYTISAGSGTGTSLVMDNAGAVASISGSGGSDIISAPVVLTSAGVNLQGGSLAIFGNISGPGAVNVIGGAILTGTNTYLGNTTVSAGANLTIGNLLAGGSLPATSTLISNGNTLFFFNPGTGILPRIVGGITLSSTGTVTVQDPGSTNHSKRSPDDFLAFFRRQHKFVAGPARPDVQ